MEHKLLAGFAKRYSFSYPLGVCRFPEGDRLLLLNNPAILACLGDHFNHISRLNSVKPWDAGIA